MKKWLLMIAFFPTYTFAQEEEFLPMPQVMLLYKSDVVLNASILKKDSAVYHIQVLDVLIGKEQGIRKAQKLQIKHANVPGCGSDDGLLSGQHKRARFYLQKEQSGWKLCESREEALVTISNTLSYFSFRTDAISVKTAEAGVKLREFYRIYSMNPLDTSFTLRCSEDSLKLMVKRNPLVRKFEEEGRSVKTLYKKHLPESTIDPPQNMLSCSLLENPPKYNGEQDLQLLIKEIQAELIYPVTANPLEGKVYLSCHITSDGEIDNIVVLRGLRDDYDNQAIAALKSHVKWEPGYQLGKPATCTLVLPITFKLAE